MIATTIVGLLASIALPKFGNMILKAKEAVLKGKLGAVRSAISIYYVDTEGYYMYSAGLSEKKPPHALYNWALMTLVPKYIGSYEDLRLEIPGKPHFPEKCTAGTSNQCSPQLYTRKSIWECISYRPCWNTWSTGWGPTTIWSAQDGQLFLWCVHTDTYGNVWSRF